MLATLRHLLAMPFLRDVAVKASRLKSLATAAAEAAPQSFHRTGTDYAADVLYLLHEAGVDVTLAGSLEEGTTPLIAALESSLLGAAQVLLDAGADANRLSGHGLNWPLRAAARVRSDAGMAWLLEHGASLTLTNAGGGTIAHALAAATRAPFAGTDAESAEFCCRWLRRVIAAEPSLLEARDRDGFTPLMVAVNAGCEACVPTLLELGADVGATNASGHTALAPACASSFLRAVRQLIAAGAASAAALPPGSLRARAVACAAVVVAIMSERGCGQCAARCGGDKAGDCANGLDILRAVLAGGMREAVGVGGLSLGSRVGTWLRAADESERISAEHALTVLQALHAGGVDVLAVGPADDLPVLHSAALAAAPAVVRWLVTEAGALLEERVSDGYTPLLLACNRHAWAAAHALLDCGARVDVQSTDAGGWWPVLLMAQMPDADFALLRRILAADRNSLLRREAGGFSSLHVAAAYSGEALRLLLGSGLPHLAEAINAAAESRWLPKDGHEAVRVTPLH
jgi:ankyrin repeat protein